MAKDITIKRIDGTIVGVTDSKPKKKPWTSNDVVLVLL